jgi:hypothetical protein
MGDILCQQHRRKVFGLLINGETITFYSTEETSNPNFYDYLQSEPLEFFTDSSCMKSSSDIINKRKKLSNEIGLNINTLKMLVKFLTMDSKFYGYTMLNVNPNENLHQDKFNRIKCWKRLNFKSLCFRSK